MSQHFKIIMSCRNVEKWIEYSITSLLNQGYENWKAIITDDCSTDKTHDILKSLVMNNNKIVLIRNEGKPKKVLHNAVNAIKTSKPQDEDVIVSLDGDDWLASSDVLEYLAGVYADNNIWVTWGSYAHNSGRNPNLSVDYSKSTGGGWARPFDSNVRVRASWRFSHLRTFKYFLWKNIRDKDFRLRATGEYYPTAIDLATMYPTIEMAGRNHCRFISKIMYVYNLGHPEAWTNKKLQDISRMCAAEITNRESYSEKTKAELLTGTQRV